VPSPCVANFDNVHTLPRDRKVASLSDRRMAEACGALRDAVGC
jgi:mRNA-degrading endonuclease toxin of MazEF toxin-antitoxin module